MKFIYLLTLSFLAFTASASAQNITGFGSTADFNATATFGAGDVAGPTSYTISGSDLGASLYGAVQTTVIGTPSSIYLKATQSTSNASTFQVELFDVSGNAVLYQGSWSSFVTGSSTTVALSFYAQDISNSVNFNGTVVSIGLLSNGSGSSLIANLDNLSVTPIPEPATYAALFGAAALCLAVWRKRRKSA